MGEDMYCPWALLKIPGSGTTFFSFPLRTPLVKRWGPPTRQGLCSPSAPCVGSPTLQNGGPKQQCPTKEQMGYITFAISGVPNASQRGTKSEVAHKWAHWLHNPCLLGGPQRFTGGDQIRCGPQDTRPVLWCQSAHLWAISDFVPCCEALGTPLTAGAM